MSTKNSLPYAYNLSGQVAFSVICLTNNRSLKYIETLFLFNQLFPYLKRNNQTWAFTF